MMDKKIKLLIFGSGNVNPINIVLGNLRKYSTLDYQIDGLNLYEDSQITLSYKYFDNIYKVKKLLFSQIPSGSKIKLIKKVFSEKAYQKYLFKCALRLRIEEVKGFIEEAHYIDQHQKYFDEYDVIDVHWVSTESASIIVNAPPKSKVILSFWGSDLMSSSGDVNYSSLLKAIRRADAITLFSIEMREIFLSKFGRQFKDKIYYTSYNHNKILQTENCADITKLRQTGYTLLAKHGFNKDDYNFIFKVGYSGFETQNHLSIIDQCFLLPESLKKKLLLIIPMTYGATPDYIETVTAYAQHKDLTACILKEYLSEEESLSLSYICDIMLNLRDNDGFNNAMIETLAAGKILVSGGWLPYSALRRNNVHFHEIYDFAEVPGVLMNIIKDFEQEIKKAESNSEKLRNMVSGEEISRKWEAVYRQVIKM